MPCPPRRQRAGCPHRAPVRPGREPGVHIADYDRASTCEQWSRGRAAGPAPVPCRGRHEGGEPCGPRATRVGSGAAWRSLGRRGHRARLAPARPRDPHFRRHVELSRFGATGDPRGRCGPAGIKYRNDGGTSWGRSSATTHGHDHADRVCGGRVVTRVTRHLRSARLLRDATHERDRCAARARCDGRTWGPHGRGARSGRRRSNCTVCRKRHPSSWSYRTSSTRSGRSLTNDESRSAAENRDFSPSPLTASPSSPRTTSGSSSSTSSTARHEPGSPSTCWSAACAR